jgi:hypothetical protein
MVMAAILGSQLAEAGARLHRIGIPTSRMVDLMYRQTPETPMKQPLSFAAMAAYMLASMSNNQHDHIQPDLPDEGTPIWLEPPAAYSYVAVASGNAFMVPDGSRIVSSI